MGIARPARNVAKAHTSRERHFGVSRDNGAVHSSSAYLYISLSFSFFLASPTSSGCLTYLCFVQ